MSQLFSSGGQSIGASASDPTLTTIMTTRKTIALTTWTFVSNNVSAY